MNKYRIWTMNKMDKNKIAENITCIYIYSFDKNNQSYKKKYNNSSIVI